MGADTTEADMADTTADGMGADITDGEGTADMDTAVDITEALIGMVDHIMPIPITTMGRRTGSHSGSAGTGCIIITTGIGKGGEMEFRHGAPQVLVGT
jgi:hypothetical protein